MTPRRLGPREAGDEGNQNRIEIVTLAIANYAFAQKLRWLFKRWGKPMDAICIPPVIDRVEIPYIWLEIENFDCNRQSDLKSL